MGYGNISGALLPEDKAAIKEFLVKMKAMMPFLISLTKAERKRLRTIGPSRIGYVSEINIASNAHRPALSGDFKLEEYNKDLALYNDLTEVMSWLMPVHEALENTIMALGGEVMKNSDIAYDYLKTHAKKTNDENIAAAVNRIKAILKRSKKEIEKK
ncbi:MAG TPA: hypothetical protein VHO90_16770 [Bacteroidales bacterium]|nr:hypothetical protein [Bacteroidales bacterium]